MTDYSETPWTTLSSTPVYRNRWIAVREDRVGLPDGRTTIYGVVTGAPAVGVLPFLDGDTVLLVRQYRYVAGRPTWEMPTGAVDAGESLEAAAQRELAEEIGYGAGRLERVASFDTSKSILDERAHLFLATDLTPVDITTLAHRPDEAEFITARPFPFAEVLRMVLAGDVADAMTIIAVLLAARRRGV